MDDRLNLTEARTLIPLLRSISTEIRDRRTRLRSLQRLHAELTQRAERITNEGFLIAGQDLDAAIAVERRGIESALREIKHLGLRVPSQRPLVVHIPGRTSNGDVVFCWEEGEEQLERNGNAV